MNDYRYPKPEILRGLDAYKHAVIEASAGTGKTYTIEHLVVDLLLHDDLVPLEKILVVTFTRRSTWDLRHRVRRILEKILNPEEGFIEAPPGALAWDMDAERRRIIQDALHKFDISPIYTIHGFCQRVLKQHAFEQNRLFDGAHVHDHTLFAESFRHVLRTHLATAPHLQPWLKAWLHLGSSVQDLMQELLATHRSRMPLAPHFSPEELDDMLNEARQHVVANKSDDKFKDQLKAAVLHKFTPLVAQELKRRKAEQGSFSYDDMLDLVWDTLGHPERGPLLAKALRDQYRFAIVDEFQDTDPVQWSIFKTLFLDSKGRCTLYIIGDPKQAIYGFRGADVQTYLRARQEVLDAGGSLLQLTGNFRSTDDLIQAYNRIFDQAAPKPLFTGNIRYEHPVTCGKPLLRLEAEGEQDEHAIQLLSVEPEGSQSLNAEAVRAAAAEAIAADIQRLLTPGSRLLIHDGDAPPRFVQARDVFILTRTGTELRFVGDTLRRWGIPFTLFKEGGLYATPEAQDILDVLHAIADPFSVSSRFRAYLTPFFGLRVEELDAWDQVEHDVAGPRTVRQLLFSWHQLARRGQLQRLFSAVLEQSGVLRRAVLLDPSERAQTNTIHILESLADLVNHESLDIHDVIVRLAAWIDGRDVPQSEDGDTQRMEGDQDAVQLMTMHKSKGLEADVVYLFGGLGRFYGGRVTVQYPDTGDRVSFFSRKLLDKDTKKLADDYDKQEAQRLMYVAVTRARARLVLPWIGRNEQGKRLLSRFDGDWATLNARLDAIVEDPTLPGPRAFSLRTIRPPGNDDDTHHDPGAAWGGALDRWTPPDYLNLRPEPERHFNDLRQRRLTVTSYSALKAADSPELPAPVLRSEIELDLTADDPEIDLLPRGRDFGVIIHHLLEHLPLQATRDADTLPAWLQHPEVAPVFNETTRLMGLSPEHLDYSQRICFNALRAPLTPLPGLAFVQADSREVEFTFPIPQPDHPLLGIANSQRLRVDRGYIVGVIDLIFSHDDRIYFADWKTDLLERYDPDALHHHVQGHYDLQARLYALAMARLLRITSPEGWHRFGGYFYLFVRAMNPERPGLGVYFHRPAWDDILALDAQLRLRFTP